LDLMCPSKISESENQNVLSSTTFCLKFILADDQLIAIVLQVLLSFHAY